MEVLVTGGAGFIGSNIVDGLIEAGHQVIVVDNLSTGKKENLNEQAEFYNLDLRDQELKKVFKKNEISHVIHHAAQIDVQHSIKDPLSDAQNNILGTINLLECCRAYNVKKIIYASSAAVYGEPDYLPVDEEHPIKAMSPYGISKHTPEHYIKMYSDLYDLKYTIFRYANVYGPRQDPKGEGGVVSIFVDKMVAEERPVIFGDGQQTRDFVHVYDIVKANLLALDKGDNILVNISTQSRDSVNDLVDYLNQILPYDLKAIYQEARKGDILHSSLANGKAKELLGWTPDYDFKDGLEQTVGYYSK
ncbi:UDP-glucose 4-epimerase [Halanaerobium saccharolyticum]|uniref:UDP-glucose 4-epimerase n=1 Tax=Halanaerobium saccharolyticum TaxID=43595 RepID=A0A4R7Z9J5_9FIRM|nr:SDR family oxidoreductase [Halanaerobium saccharolyticum]RAK12593.1 UDP-glucose 4-epimerase [Halanaerobium saccharolyticum]TDW06519.1 UDP-glucose 4-epimerase [Halanaerobium saccharolyticum]TDX61767.1 UDP-glucose 4-epimerase [Halanaerobium saccharolyticum]